MNPEVMGSLSEEEQNAIFAGHDAFQKETVRPGELLSSVALADPSNTKTVRVRDDVPAVADGPHIEAKESLAGFLGRPRYRHTAELEPPCLDRH